MHIHRDLLSKYVVLIDNFLRKDITALDFEREYLKIFKEDKTMWTEEEYKILERLFESVDAFCSDPSLISESDITESELREEAANARNELQQLTKP